MLNTYLYQIAASESDQSTFVMPYENLLSSRNVLMAGVLFKSRTFMKALREMSEHFEYGVAWRALRRARAERLRGDRSARGTLNIATLTACLPDTIGRPGAAEAASSLRNCASFSGVRTCNHPFRCTQLERRRTCCGGLRNSMPRTIFQDQDLKNSISGTR